MTVDFKDKRFNPDATPFHELARKMAKTFGHGADLQVAPEIAQLLRLRVAQLNECSYCSILHTKKAQEIGIEEARITGLVAWYNSDLYSKEEKAVLAYCDALNDGVDRDFNDKHQALLAVEFTETQIAEIAAIVINMNLWTRLKLAQGATPEYAKT